MVAYACHPNVSDIFWKKKRFETKTILLSFRKSFLNKNNFVLNILFSFRKHFHLFAN